MKKIIICLCILVSSITVVSCDEPTYIDVLSVSPAEKHLINYLNKHNLEYDSIVCLDWYESNTSGKFRVYYTDNCYQYFEVFNSIVCPASDIINPDEYRKHWLN